MHQIMGIENSTNSAQRETQLREKDEFDYRIKKFEDVNKTLTKIVKSLRGKNAQVTSEIKLLIWNKNQLDDSIYLFIDKVLSKHIIIRATFYSKFLNQGGIVILMDKAHDIMTEIKGHLT